MKTHPNTIVSGISGLGLGTIVVQAANHFGAHLSAQDGLYVASGLTAAALFLGRNGLVGTWTFVRRLVLHGTSAKA